MMDNLHAAVRRGVLLPIPLNSRNARGGNQFLRNLAYLSPFLLQMRMNMRTKECRRRAAECAEKALCAPDQEVRRTFSELAEHRRALAEQTEFLERYH
jgi:hypothetical protein